MSLTGTTIDLFADLGEFARNVCSVAIEHWSVSVADLTRVVQDDDLGQERSGFLGWVVLRVASNVATTDILQLD